eukprot:5576610-Alexandrium_andersonii.AAC.1
MGPAAALALAALARPDRADFAGRTRRRGRLAADARPGGRNCESCPVRFGRAAKAGRLTTPRG